MTPILKNLYNNYVNFANSLEEPNYKYHMDDPQNNCTRNFTFDEFISVFFTDIEFRKSVLILENNI